MSNSSDATTNTGSSLGTILNVIGTAIIVIAIIVCLFLAVPKFLGITSYTVLTGSMEPAIPTGSLVMAKYADPATLQIGDVVVFNADMSAIPVTHRIVDNQPTEGYLITQGDANPAPDVSPIPYQNVIGKVLFHIPAAGKILAPLGSLRGKLCLICIILGGLLLSMAGKRASQRE